MSVTVRSRFVNPRLGTFFGIFASLFAAIFLMLLISAELGANEAWLRIVALIGPLALYSAFALASFTTEPFEFFAAGRRVPAVYNGVIVAFAASGGTAFICLTGTLFLNGYDAWCIVMGITSGFVFMAMLVAPYLRKFGAYTVPTFLARRLESRFVRVMAAAFFAVPMLLILIAELRLGVWVAQQLTGAHQELLFAIIVGSAGLAVVAGGMRASTWSGTAQAIAALIGVVLLSGIVGVMMTNLPVPQLSSGPLLRGIGRLESDLGVPTPQTSLFAFEFAANELASVTGRIAEPFASVGLAGFLLTVLTLALGVAGAPWLVVRCTTTPGVYEARKTLGWAVFFFGLLVVSASSVAVFLRHVFMNDLVGRSREGLPAWFNDLQSVGLANVTGSVPNLPVNAFQIHRDAVAFVLPQAVGMTEVLSFLILAGALGAILVAVSTTAQALGAIVAEDVIGGLRWSPPPKVVRLWTGRIAVAVVLLLAALAAGLFNGDPLALTLAALSISAATAFPALVMAIWWRKCTSLGVVAALTSGFVLSVLAILAIPAGWGPVANPLATLIAVVISALAGLIVSTWTPLPSRVAVERLRDMRIPGGETIYDREMRLLRLRQRETTQPAGS